MSHDNRSAVRRYIVLWGVLLGALLVSLLLAPSTSKPIVVGAIFAVATGKALLVASYYMHLAAEPRFLRLVVAGAVSLVAVLFFGLYPDIVWKVSAVTPSAHTPGVALAAPMLRPGDPGAGEKVYVTYCQACHQADGRGMNGTLGADFVDDKTRLAKADDDLLTSIRAGKTGNIGTMPAWGTTLSAQQQVDALSFLRKRFGGSP